MAPGNRKRPLGFIDLTDSAALNSRTQGQASKVRKTTGAISAGAGAQSYGESSEADDYIEDGEDLDASQSFQDRSSLQLYSKFPGKIVGCRYYNGYVTRGEMVLIQRQPHNQYDQNAIQALNVSRSQIGHIPRVLAAKLAPLMDQGLVHVECSTTGSKEYFDCPIELKIFGASEPARRAHVKQEMEKRGLRVVELNETERQEKREQKKKEEMKKKLKNSGALAGVGRSGPIDLTGSQFMASSSASQIPSLDEIVSQSEKFNPRNADQMVEKFGSNLEELENMPLADQPKFLKSTLLPYQRQGLRWLIDRENPKVPTGANNSEEVQLWKRHPTNPRIITNLATNFSLQNEDPQLASGGILADDMGLGKTVQVISLILSDMELRGKTSTGPTLIVAPLSVMSNWSKQIEQHVKDEHMLNVRVYHGPKRGALNSNTLDQADVVVTTYDTIRTDFFSTAASNRGKSGIFSIPWRRIVLDEGHNIRNPAAKTSTAICALQAKSRWILTGTPIVNSLKDLFSLVRFLRLSGGLSQYELFNCAIIRPLNQGFERAGKLLVSLMRSICLRRKKEMSFIDLKLPELSEYVHRIQFLPHEREKYDALYAQAKGMLDEFKSADRNRTNVYRHVLETLLRLRQVCNHWKLCGPDRFEGLKAPDGQIVLDLTPENREMLGKMLQLCIDSQDDCPVCIDTLNEPVITVCTHTFCSACIEKVIETQHKCPLCRAPLDSKDQLIKPPREEAAVNIDPSENSSKVEALLSILKASKGSKGNKTIVFSQWTSFLDVVEKQLDQNSFKFTRIDGKMPAAARDAAMDALEKDPEVTVLLASLGVCSVGLNLVAANQVVLADSWWAPAIEDQAIDRVHRLGQKKPTTVFRLVMEDSIEDRVLNIQADKRRLMQLALAEKKGKRGAQKGARLADIQKLLG